MAIDIALAVALLAFAVAGVAVRHTFGASLEGIRALIPEPTAPYDDAPIEASLAELTSTVADHYSEIDTLRGTVVADFEAMAERERNLRVAVAEGIERVDRSERRIKATIERAQRKLDEVGASDEGVEAEIAELRLLHGEGSGGSSLQAMHPHVEGSRHESSSVPGATVDQLRRARGF